MVWDPESFCDGPNTILYFLFPQGWYYWKSNSNLNVWIAELQWQLNSLHHQGSHENIGALIREEWDSLTFWDSLPLLPRLECSGATTDPCSVYLLDSSDPPTSASRVAGTTDMLHHTWLFIYLFIYFWDRVLLSGPGWTAVVWSQLTATSDSQVQVILLL